MDLSKLIDGKTYTKQYWTFICWYASGVGGAYLTWFICECLGLIK